MIGYSSRHSVGLLVLCAAGLLLGGCGPKDYRSEADKVAYKAIEQAQSQALDKVEPFTIESAQDALRARLIEAQFLPTASPASLGSDKLDPIKNWPEKNYPRKFPASEPSLEIPDEGPLVLSLIDALQIAARNSREYQSEKEEVFRTSLDLDLSKDDFRGTWAGTVETAYSTDLKTGRPDGGLVNTDELSWTQKLKNGTKLTSRIVVDLVKLCTMDSASSFGILADSTITIPLLRGSGVQIVTEPLIQSERDLIYAIYSFERFKRTFAVRVASEYLLVIQQLDQIRNTEDNYRRLKSGVKRTRRMADAGRLPEIQVDQTKQDELRARERWIVAQASYARQLDSFKILIGLPTDADIELDSGELERLAESAKFAIESLNGDGDDAPSTQPAGNFPTTAPAEDIAELDPPKITGGGPLEMDPAEAVLIAFENRLDLRTSIGKVYDAQRKVVVAADGLRGELTLGGSYQWGERRGLSTANTNNAALRPERGSYEGSLVLDLPLERTEERNQYRDSFIRLEQAVRSAQDKEDSIKSEVRDELRNLVLARESIKIQVQSVRLADRRVASTALFLQAGRAEVRDVLESQEALVSAKNALSRALVDYRVSELRFQRDTGVLEVNEKGIWREYQPENIE